MGEELLAQTEFQLQVNKHTRRPELLDPGNAAICSVLSRVPGGCRSCWGLHFSWNEVTQQDEKQTHSTCLSSSSLHKHRWEERGTLLHLCHGCAALAKRRAGAQALRRGYKGQLRRCSLCVPHKGRVLTG